MARQGMTLHVSVVYWTNLVFYLFHGGIFSSHGPELAGKSLVDAKKIVERKYDVEIEHIVTQSDNCSFMGSKLLSSINPPLINRIPPPPEFPLF